MGRGHRHGVLRAVGPTGFQCLPCGPKVSPWVLRRPLGVGGVIMQ